MLTACLILAVTSITMSTCTLAATVYLLRSLLTTRLAVPGESEIPARRAPQAVADAEAERRAVLEFRRAHGLPQPTWVPTSMAKIGSDGPLAERNDIVPLREIR